MILSLVLAMVATGMGPSDVPRGRASFGGMPDLEIDGWLRWNGFYHAANAYRCRGFSQDASMRRLGRALGADYDARQAAISRSLKARYGDRYREEVEFLAFGYRVLPAYCRRIRHVVSDMMRGTANLERRLGLAR
jgi:hypothetical protein